MQHFSTEELKCVLEKIRNKQQASEKELAMLKKYIPMHLSKTDADNLIKIVEEIREGKRPVMTETEKTKLQDENLNLSIKNLLVTMPMMSQEEYEQFSYMCEKLRKHFSAES